MDYVPLASLYEMTTVKQLLDFIVASQPNHASGTDAAEDQEGGRCCFHLCSCCWTLCNVNHKAP
eukprot:4074804-Amphidinium_carterae.1